VQLAEKWSALRTPSQFAAGFGARHLKSPTGGAAKGTPLKTVIDASFPGMPETSPLWVFTGWLRAHSGVAKATVRTASTRLLVMIHFSLLRLGESIRPQTRCRRNPAAYSD